VYASGTVAALDDALHYATCMGKRFIQIRGDELDCAVTHEQTHHIRGVEASCQSSSPIWHLWLALEWTQVKHL
jgi:hypothetical protein